MQWEAVPPLPQNAHGMRKTQGHRESRFLFKGWFWLLKFIELYIYSLHAFMLASQRAAVTKYMGTYPYIE